MINQIKDCKDKVKKLLTAYPQARESDSFLLAVFWLHELEDEIDSLSAREFLHLLSKGSLQNPESVRRNRQFLQAKHISLRGKNYQAKQEEKEEVKNQINKEQ